MTDKLNVTPVPEEVAETPVPDTQNIPEEKLSLSDLNTMRQIIEICGSRGAIRANEMATVGALHTKLHSFLVTAGVIPAAQAPGQAPTPAPEADTGEAPATAETADAVPAE